MYLSPTARIAIRAVFAVVTILTLLLAGGAPEDFPLP
jgi:hypothetical protein